MRRVIPLHLHFKDKGTDMAARSYTVRLLLRLLRNIGGVTNVAKAECRRRIDRCQTKA